MMRTLEKFELEFWNGFSISILIDAGFVLELNNGLITGIERNNNGDKNERKCKILLVNSYDKELKIKTLAEAKKYFKVPDELLDDKGCEFNKELESCKNLFDVCDLLNEFSDVLGNGSRYSVVE